MSLFSFMNEANKSYPYFPFHASTNSEITLLWNLHSSTSIRLLFALLGGILPHFHITAVQTELDWPCYNMLACMLLECNICRSCYGRNCAVNVVYLSTEMQWNKTSIVWYHIPMPFKHRRVMTLQRNWAYMDHHKVMIITYSNSLANDIAIIGEIYHQLGLLTFRSSKPSQQRV